MAGLLLPTELGNNLADMLQEDDIFKSNSNVLAFFENSGILRPFSKKLKLPDPSGIEGRVKNCLALLLDNQLNDGTYLILPFLEELKKSQIKESKTYSDFTDLLSSIKKQIPSTAKYPNSKSNVLSDDEVDYLTQIVQILYKNRFVTSDALDDLHILLWELGIPHGIESFGGTDPLFKAREIVYYFYRRQELNLLIQHCSKLIPNLKWPSPPKNNPFSTPARDFINSEKLAYYIANTFSHTELRLLCFDLYIDFESIKSKDIIFTSRILVEVCQRENKLKDLVSLFQIERPSIQLGKSLIFLLINIKTVQIVCQIH